MAKLDTDRLRAIGLARLEATGYGYTRIDRRKQLYCRNDGKRFALATNMKRVLICTTNGTEASAKLDFEDAEYILFVAPTSQPARDGDQSGYDVYWLPSNVVSDFARIDHQKFLETARTKGNNTTWQQVLDDRAEVLGHGYGPRYAKYLLP